MDQDHKDKITSTIRAFLNDLLPKLKDWKTACRPEDEFALVVETSYAGFTPKVFIDNMMDKYKEICGHDIEPDLILDGRKGVYEAIDMLNLMMQAGQSSAGAVYMPPLTEMEEKEYENLVREGTRNKLKYTVESLGLGGPPGDWSPKKARHSVQSPSQSST